MENKNKTTFNLKKLEDGIQKLKDNKILPQNFELRGVAKCIAWGTMTKSCNGEIQEWVVFWHQNGIGFLGRKNDTRDSLILDEDDSVVLGQAVLFNWAKKLFIGDLTNN